MAFYCEVTAGLACLSPRPERRFIDEVHEEKTEEIHKWKIILKRDNSSDEQVGLASSLAAAENQICSIVEAGSIRSLLLFTESTSPPTGEAKQVRGGERRGVPASSKQNLQPRGELARKTRRLDEADVRLTRFPHCPPAAVLRPGERPCRNQVSLTAARSA